MKFRLLIILILLQLPALFAEEFSKIDESTSSPRLTSATSDLETSPPTKWVTGIEFRRQLDQIASWSAANAELQTEIESFRRQTSIFVLRDRRLDPRRLVDVSLSGVPRWRILEEIATHADSAVVQISDRLCVIASRDMAARLPVLIDLTKTVLNEALEQRPSPNSRGIGSIPGSNQNSRRMSLAWESLAEPRQLVQQATSAADLGITNPEFIPHDLWQECRGPEVTAAEFLALVFNQFDLMPMGESDSRRTIRIAPFDQKFDFERQINLKSGERAAITGRLSTEWPGIKLTSRGSTLIVSTSLGNHVAIQQMLNSIRREQATSVPAKTPGSNSLRTRLFTLTIERSTVGELVEYFRRNNIRIEITDEKSQVVQTKLKAEVKLKSALERVAAEPFFRAVFGEQFSRIEVLDDRVILSVTSAGDQ